MDSKISLEEVKPDKGICIPGIGYHATLVAKYDRQQKSQSQGAKKAVKFSYQNDIYGNFVRDQVRYKNREKKLFDLLEDKLDNEDERTKMLEYEKEEHEKAIASGDLPQLEEEQ